MAKKHPLVKFSETSRYGGSVFVSATEEPVAAATGTVLVVLGAKSVDDMVMIVLGGRPKNADDATVPLPTVETVAQVIPRRRTAEWSEPVDVSRDTQPNSALLQYATEQVARRAWQAAKDLPFAEQKLQQAEADLAADIAAKRRGQIGRLREEVANLKQRVVDLSLEMQGVPQGPETHALVVGNAAYNLDLIVLALRALGSTSGQLVSTGCLSTGILTCDQGMALVMPFRTAGLPGGRKS